MKKVNIFNIIVLLSLLISGGLLIHDIVIFAIKPLFTGDFIMLTYFGFFIDVIALFMLEVSSQYIKDWFSK